MAVKTFTVGSVLTASDTNTYLANSGLVYVAQSTISGTVSQLTMANVFSSTYDNYLLSYTGLVVSNTGVPLTLKLGNGTVGSFSPTTSGFYGNTYYCSVGISGSISNAGTSNAAFTEAPSVTTAYANAGVVEIQSPFLAQSTQFQYSGNDQTFWRLGSSYHNANTSYSGLQIVPWTGTFSAGTFTIYGYRKG